MNNKNNTGDKNDLQVFMNDSICVDEGWVIVVFTVSNVDSDEIRFYRCLVAHIYILR